MWALYQAGFTLEEVGDLFNLTRQRVSQIFQKEGLRLRPPGPSPKGPHTCPRCFGLYPKGKYAEHRMTQEHKAVWVDPRRLVERERQMVADYLAGVPTKDICKKYDTYAPELYRSLKRQGVEINRGGGRYVRTPEIRARIRESQQGRYRERDAPTY